MKLQDLIFRIIHVVVILFGFVALISISSVIITGTNEGYFSLELCFDNSCIKRASGFYSSIIGFFTSSVQILAAIATALGIVVAALTFKNTSQTNALNSHISHFKIFSDYLALELNKREKIKSSSINTFDWYNLIFTDSILGSVSVSEDYIDVLKKINSEIKTTNDNATRASQGPFRHHEHQQRMRKVFLRLGIQIEHYPKNDYWLIENEIISLIDTINQAFCQKPRVGILHNRDYFSK
ncbi:retron Ec48 family effector membrane protein [Vibrio crassostreae]|uniref:retron Ec48 family effector membrane protein n=1 Tax=Vibrio crassostreae TaxID=246167 RepID=UPI001B302E81